ncbi:hypothetical protein BS50DRAFT_572564 [Corynespora cassiicola Philippines]|uniref:Uncharacterized protein n=1 Tax=Corynespora cassiicola Philippines TaxID=1448308 RepID=A0A2T2NVJ5_CORCC|nr:hypothetical protein BS50DRAFT_572564 [Corynespora cassiicola Philippines]
MAPWAPCCIALPCPALRARPPPPPGSFFPRFLLRALSRAMGVLSVLISLPRPFAARLQATVCASPTPPPGHI